MCSVMILIAVCLIGGRILQVQGDTTWYPVCYWAAGIILVIWLLIKISISIYESSLDSYTIGVSRKLKDHDPPTITDAPLRAVKFAERTATPEDEKHGVTFVSIGLPPTELQSDDAIDWAVYLLGSLKKQQGWYYVQNRKDRDPVTDKERSTLSLWSGGHLSFITENSEKRLDISTAKKDVTTPRNVELIANFLNTTSIEECYLEFKRGDEVVHTFSSDSHNNTLSIPPNDFRFAIQQGANQLIVYAIPKSSVSEHVWKE